MKSTLIVLLAVMFSNGAIAQGTISIGSVKINGREVGNPVTEVPNGSLSHRQRIDSFGGRTVIRENGKKPVIVDEWNGRTTIHDHNTGERTTIDTWNGNTFIRKR